MEIYIIRHGETHWNSQNLLQGRADIELNENGRELAGITGQNLEPVAFDKIYSSPLIRAYETACLIRGHRNIPIIRDDRLQEISFGEYEGKNSVALFNNTSDPFHHFFTNPDKFQPAKDGESFEDVIHRGKDFVQNVVEPEASKCERIMIVAHGAMNKGLMCHILNHSIEHYWDYGLQNNCGAIIVKLEHGAYTLLKENAVFY